jgi:solute carrier family 25 uncoupling protein 27
MQADGRRVILGEAPRYRGLTHALTTIVRKDGVSGLWRGVGPNAQRAALVNCGELAAYDQAKTMVLGYGLQDGLGAHTVASVLSGLSATLFSCPADVVKTRMMNEERQGTVNLYRCAAGLRAVCPQSHLWSYFSGRT